MIAPPTTFATPSLSPKNTMPEATPTAVIRCGLWRIIPSSRRTTQGRYTAPAAGINSERGSLDHPQHNHPSVFLGAAPGALDLGGARGLGRQRRGSGRDALLAGLAKPTQHVSWADPRAPVAGVVGALSWRPHGHAIPSRGVSAAREEVVGSDGGGRPAPREACRLRLLRPLCGAPAAGADTCLRRAAPPRLSVAPSSPLARARGDAFIGAERSAHRGQATARGGATRPRGVRSTTRLRRRRFPW